jgi:hypothetical protein
MRTSKRRLLLVGTVALAMVLPGTANSFTLDQLLAMPIEQLLRLEITSRQPAKVTALGPPAVNSLRATEHRDVA